MKDSKKQQQKEKKPYIKPKIESEDLMAFAAVCNGNTTGGRKASALPPANCRADRLSS